jgi:hypothetical protein
VGVLICDTLGDTRQCCVVRTNEEGSMLLAGSTNEVHDGNFMLMKADTFLNTSSSGSLQPENVHFGEPFLLRHISSGRFLCNGVANIENRTVSSAPAELRVEHQRLTLLPPSLNKRSGSWPLDHLLAPCTFRFIPCANYGRTVILTGDNMWLTTEGGHIIRAGIEQKKKSFEVASTNGNLFEIAEGEEDGEEEGEGAVAQGLLRSSSMLQSIDPLAPKPFDP